MGRNSATGGVRHVAASTTGGIRTESWSYKVVAVVENQVVRAHAAPQRVRDNFVNALKLLANQHQDGDSLGESSGGRCPKKKLVKDGGGAANAHHDGQSRGG